MHVPLSQTEQRVMQLIIVQCLSSKEAARVLGLSHRTVEVHRTHVKTKLGARNFADIIRKLHGEGYGAGLFAGVGSGEGQVLQPSEGRLSA